jgi:hypothetical protein
MGDFNLLDNLENIKVDNINLIGDELNFTVEINVPDYLNEISIV